MSSEVAKLPTLKTLYQDPILLLGMGFGSGLAPKAPGTWGSLLGILLIVPLVLSSLEIAWIVFLLATLVGSYICAVSAHRLGVHDHSGIVWDEFVGVWLVILCLPQQSWMYWVSAFVLFRIFDIFKPWPIGWVDKQVSGGKGIMLDDIIAALYSIIIIWVVQTGFL